VSTTRGPIDLVCDECQNWKGGNPGETARFIRKLYRADGWERYRIDGELKDLCPACLGKDEGYWW